MCPYIDQVILSNKLKISCLPNTDITSQIAQVFGPTYKPNKDFDISPGDVVIDIGANIGVFTVYAAKNGAEKIISCEPQFDNFEKLIKNIEDNRFKNIIPYNVAVGKKNHDAELFISKNGGMHSLFRNRDKRESGFYFGEKIKVKVITLSELFKNNCINNCNLLKLDCEGSEFDILLTAGDTLNIVDKIIMEYHNNFTEYTGLKLTHYLEGNNFVVKMTETDISGCGMIYAKKNHNIV